jgi:hypothetical protein
VGYQPWLAQPKDYKIGIFCFSAVFRSKSIDQLGWTLDNVSKVDNFAKVYWLKQKQWYNKYCKK